MGGERASARGPAGPILWGVLLAAALAAYALLNPPLGAALAVLRPVGFAAAVVAALLGLGAPLAGWAWPRLEGVDRRLAAVAVGVGLTSAMVFALGLLGVVSPAVFAAWILAGLVLAAVDLVRRPPRGDLGALGPLDAVSLAVIAVVLAAVLPMVAAPETTNDALEFHLLVPKAYLAHGGIVPLPGFVESNYPSLAEHLFLLVLPLGGPVACKALHFWFGLLVLVALARLSARLDPEGGRLLAPALYQSMPVAALILGWAWNDALFVLLLLLALTAVVDYHVADEGRRGLGAALRAGVMAGLAGWTKYTFVMIAVALLPVVVLGLMRWRWRPRHVLAAGLPVAAISAAWLGKNWAFTGNPVFPFLNGIFGSPLWNPAAQQYFVNTLTRYETPERGWLDLLLYPLHLTLTPRIMDVHLGVLPLLLAPLLLVRSGSRAAAPLKAFAAGSAIAWLLFQTEARSLLTVLAVVACLGAAVIGRAVRSRSNLALPAASLIAAAAAANLVVISVIALATFDPVRHLVGLESSADYLRRSARSQPTYEWLDQAAGVRTVLLVGLHGPFYLDRPMLFSSCCDPPVAETVAAGAESPGEIRDRLAALDVSHVVFDRSEWAREHRAGLYSWAPADRLRFEAFLERHCDPVATFGNDTVYALRPP